VLKFAVLSQTGGDAHLRPIFRLATSRSESCKRSFLYVGLNFLRLPRTLQLSKISQTAAVIL